jgi:hypothetical protein
MSNKFVIHELNNVFRVLSLLSTLMLVSCRQFVVFLNSCSLKVLESCIDSLTNLDSDIFPSFRIILLPLITCGFGYQLSTRDQGFNVIGVEGVAKAIEVYKRESGIEMTESLLDNKIKCHQTKDGKMKILEANFFGLSSPSIDDAIDCVWDRASIVVVNSVNVLTQNALRNLDMLYLFHII